MTTSTGSSGMVGGVSPTTSIVEEIVVIDVGMTQSSEENPALFP